MLKTVATLHYDMEESISGFKERGGWATIVEHGERITAALRDEGVSGDAFDDWDEWRPKAHERLSEDIDDKTAEHVSIDEGEGEKAEITPQEDMGTATEEAADTVTELAEGDLDDAVDEGGDAVKYAGRAADSIARKAVRMVETPIYQHVMTQVSPYYFDNELVSGNLERTRDADEPYVFEVNINNDEQKESVKERLAAYDEEIDRWRLETDPETETHDAVEGTDSHSSSQKMD
jgi:hypothetical protein